MIGKSEKAKGIEYSLLFDQNESAIDRHCCGKEQGTNIFNYSILRRQEKKRRFRFLIIVFNGSRPSLQAVSVGNGFQKISSRISEEFAGKFLQYLRKYMIFKVGHLDVDTYVITRRYHKLPISFYPLKHTKSLKRQTPDSKNIYHSKLSIYEESFCICSVSKCSIKTAIRNISLSIDSIKEHFIRSTYVHCIE